MVMDNLGNKLRETLKNITKSIFIDKRLINELVKEACKIGNIQVEELEKSFEEDNSTKNLKK